jgi:hypothetical protein
MISASLLLAVLGNAVSREGLEVSPRDRRLPDHATGDAQPSVAPDPLQRASPAFVGR